METSSRSVRVRVWLYVLLAAGLLCLFALEISRSKRMEQLRAENSALSAQVADAEAAYGRIAELEQGRQELLRALDSPAPELLALRDEVGRLRAQTNEIAELRVARAQAQLYEANLKEEVLRLKSELTRKPAVPRIGGWVGVSLRDTEPAGASIIQVVDGGPADRAHLRVGDRILAVDGQAIASAEEFKHLMSRTAGGQTLALDIIRQDAQLRVAVQPMDWPQ